MTVRCRYFAALPIALCLHPSIAAPVHALSLQSAALANEYVIIATGTSCPGSPNWQGEKLSPNAKGGETICSYNGDETHYPELTTMQNSGSIVEIVQDALVVVALTQPQPRVLEGRMWRALHAQFDFQTGRVPLQVVAGNTKVRFAAIDTSPTRDVAPERYPGRSPHGHAMLNMAKSLLCLPTGECVSDLTSQLALAYYREPTSDAIIHDPIDGGDMGSLADLVRAIDAEVAAWLDDPLEPELVLNLSIGWDLRYGGGEPTPAAMAPGFRAVYKAIEYAVCHGATVVAASGNHSGVGSRGAWGPAFWETHPAPDQARCEELLGQSLDPADFPEPGTVYRPLVYGASGFRYDRLPLSNASRESQARLAAYGDATAVLSHLPETPTETYAGSSVSTVAISAMAAAMAYYRPDLPVFKRMRMLYESGDDLGRAADFCLGDCGQDDVTSFNVHGVSMCRALTAACDDPARPCPMLPVCETGDHFPPDLHTELIHFFRAAMPEPVDVDELTVELSLPSFCEADTLFLHPYSSPSGILCSDDQLVNALADPPIRPTPESAPCQSCVLFRNSEALLIEIDPHFQNDVREATLTACGTSYQLSSIPLHRGALSLVSGIQVSAGCGPVKMSFVVDDPIGGPSAVTNPVLVLPY